ncbi:accessory factor UbiK family protein [Viridibacterium curvum]|uniref:Ubiquinone biosynthesis accessory factor UbiK n=1 Tax=Viridibacterium curvum TaxID=1101404 RepID=A0ABP9QSY8_9RHOO
MINTQLLQDFGKQLSELLAHSPARDIERNARALFGSMASRMDLVSREEFEVQRSLLQRASERLAALEARVAELEARKP